ncbi:MAG: amidohydrolase [Oscillospiraceae bacterium]|nr:amidohydrolase [Oscillospiraceae bacterium]MBR2890761.1 amidohydrolase [Oscillospiraceae bacterium]
MRITNGILLTMEGQNYENGYVDFENGVITALGDAAKAPAYAGEILDAQGGYILPGLIDAHSHIGISEEGFRWEGEDCNETTSPVTPDLRAMDGFYPFDIAIPKARRAGVTTVVVCPGSTNVIGGQTAAIKLAGTDVEDMVLKSPCSIKCAMGENPKRNYGENKGRSPMTRMATAAIFRNTLTKAQRYLAKKEAGEDLFDPEMEALIPLLKREIPAHIHAHRSDDILTALRIVKEFNLRCSIIHTTGGGAIVPQIAAAGIIPIVGPCTGPAGKPETVGGSLALGAKLHQAGVDFCLTTDHDVEALWFLPYFASMTVREGLDEESALRAITINGARAAGIEDRVGSLKVGKDADIVVFSGHPFHYLTKTTAVFINGKRED